MKRLLVVLLLSVSFGYSQVPDPKPSTYVNDFTGIIPADKVNTLNAKIYGIELASSVQIAIVIIDKLPENVEIEDYAREVGRQWHVGNAKNGLVYVAAISEHKQRLEVAQNLEGDIPDKTALDIMDEMKPFFRQQDYYDGIDKMLDDINDHINPVIKEQRRLAAVELQKQRDKEWESIKSFGVDIFWILMIFGVLYGIVYIVWLRDYWKQQRSLRKGLREANEIQMRRKHDTAESIRRSYSNDSYVYPITTASLLSDNTPTSSSYTAPDTSSSSTQSDDSSSSYGNWGSGSSSSDDSSFDSGFTGGGASDTW